jgi:hypothetical protein
VIGEPNSTGKEMRLLVRRKVAGLCRRVRASGSARHVTFPAFQNLW